MSKYKLCEIIGCERKSIVRGMCRRCYNYRYNQKTHEFAGKPGSKNYLKLIEIEEMKSAHREVFIDTEWRDQGETL